MKTLRWLAMLFLLAGGALAAPKRQFILWAYASNAVDTVQYSHLLPAVHGWSEIPGSSYSLVTNWPGGAPGRVEWLVDVTDYGTNRCSVYFRIKRETL